MAISDNINASKEKETILLTEVEINGKAAQLDGTYALEKRRTEQMVRFVIIGWKIQLLKIIQQI